MERSRYVEVAVFRGPPQPLTYRIPPHCPEQVRRGVRALVPLGRREALGLVTKTLEEPPGWAEQTRLKNVTAFLDDEPVLPEDLLDLCCWLSDYYLHPLPSVLEAVLPASLRVRPEIHYRITEDGMKEIERRDTSTRMTAGARALESLLREAQEVDETHLSLLPRGWKKHLRMLEQMGWVVRKYHWPSMDLSEKRIKEVVLLKEPPESRTARSSHLRNFLHVLKSSGGRCTLRELRRRVRNADYWAKRLAEEGWIRVQCVECVRESTLAQDVPETEPVTLTGDQRDIIRRVAGSLGANLFAPFVLYGVTGSGKTEVYLALVEETLAKGRDVLVLVPEIALSTQMEALFRARFGGRLAVWHSGLSPGVRDDQWRKIVSGEKPVVLGVRSAVFAPLPRPGLIIVDEEHDGSYKQEDRFRYHARDTALMRGKLLEIPVLLGSATPSLQSVHACRQGRYTLLTLSKRIEERPLPRIQVVDMRRHRGPFRILSPELLRALEETLEHGRQAILFLNRRGFSTIFLCRTCGAVLQCPSCAVSVAYHRSTESVLCHYCGWSAELPESCPACARPSLIPFGFGTERVEEEFRNHFPRVNAVRVDRDAVTHPRRLVQVLNGFRSGKFQVLIGTQMIAKGHDFPDVTLVGVINADVSLQVPDYRSGETTVQILLQVAGRAGRGATPGRVLVQTYNPSHHAIRAVVGMDYMQFCDRELDSRKALQYPPFSRFARILVTGRRENEVQRTARLLAEEGEALKEEYTAAGKPVSLMGPAPAPVRKIKGRFRWNLYVKAWRNAHLQPYLRALLIAGEHLQRSRAVRIVVDRDPVSGL